MRLCDEHIFLSDGLGHPGGTRVSESITRGIWDVSVLQCFCVAPIGSECDAARCVVIASGRLRYGILASSSLTPSHEPSLACSASTVARGWRHVIYRAR